MILIVGLGNPGKKFEKTRHNVGFVAIDEFAKENDFPSFESNKKADALVSEQNNVLLAKPQTFMNESGKAVKELIRNHPVENIIVIHDDIDLETGKIKIVKERGSAGHKGVESIIKAVGNENLIRIRIGIAPAASAKGSVEAKKIVLKNFSKQEQPLINESISKAAEALTIIISSGLEKAMNQFN